MLIAKTVSPITFYVNSVEQQFVWQSMIAFHVLEDNILQLHPVKVYLSLNKFVKHLDCMASCVDCNSATECVQCSPGFYLAPDKSACFTSCDPPLLSSTDPNNGGVICLSPCETGYWDEEDLSCRATCDGIYESIPHTFYTSCRRNGLTTVETILEAAQGATTALIHASNAISSGSIRGISAGIAGRIFVMIKFMNITYSEELLRAFAVWSPSILPFEMEIAVPFEMDDEKRDEDLPYVFKRWETPSNFFSNFWDDIFYYLIVAGVYLIVCVIRLISINWKTNNVSRMFIEGTRILLQNYLISQLLMANGELIFYAALDYKTTTFNKNAAVTTFTVSLMLILLLIGISVFYF